MAEELTIWCLLKAEGFNDYAVAGIMGNLYAESHLNPKNLQDTCNLSRGISDEEYTRGVDDGTYTAFSSDYAGYGIAQWTDPGRKRKLFLFVKGRGVSIGDLQAQVKYLAKELKEDYPEVYKSLRSAKSVESASNVFLIDFESPSNTGNSVKNYRTSLGINYYLKYQGKSGAVKISTSKDSLVTISLPLIEFGSVGPTVRALQILLNGNDCPCGDPNGEVGFSTKSGITKYQRNRGLTVDGKAGVQVFTSLLT